MFTLSHRTLSEEESRRIVFIGDSLTEGYGIKREEAYPALVQRALDKEHKGKNWVVVNSGISGSTSASAVSRVKWHLQQKPALVVLALGANDGLRGLLIDSLDKNLTAAIELCQKNNVKVILIGIRVPPNYGEKYSQDFEAVFPRLAKKFKVPLIPFLLDKVAGQKDLNQPDGIHPTPKGHIIMAETVYQELKKHL
jgi:acyl-CoA thioesterase I